MTIKRSHRRADSIEPTPRPADSGQSERGHGPKLKCLAHSQLAAESKPDEPRVYDSGHIDANVPEDLTQALTLHSKRTQRRHKKLESKARKAVFEPRGLLDLPYELLMRILGLVR